MNPANIADAGRYTAEQIRWMAAETMRMALPRDPNRVPDPWQPDPALHAWHQAEGRR